MLDKIKGFFAHQVITILIGILTAFLAGLAQKNQIPIDHAAIEAILVAIAAKVGIDAGKELLAAHHEGMVDRITAGLQKPPGNP